MLRGPSVLTVVLGAATLATVAALVAPDQIRAAQQDLRAESETATDEGRKLDAEREVVLRQAAVGDQIAVNLCDERITLAEALETVTAMARCAPDWFAHLRRLYRAAGKVSPAAADREVTAEYLLTKIESMAMSAEQLGDAERAAALSGRLRRLREEVRLLPLAESGRSN
jgi:hypothetical protein